MVGYFASVSEPNSEPRAPYNSPRWSPVRGGTPGTAPKKTNANPGGVVYNGEGRSEAELRAGVARVFLLLMSCGYCKSPQKHYRHKASHSVGLRAVAIAPTLRARILEGSLPVVSSLRDSTTGYSLSPLSGLKIPLASLANTFSTSDLSSCCPPTLHAATAFPVSPKRRLPLNKAYVYAYLRRRRTAKPARASRLSVAVAGSGTVTVMVPGLTTEVRSALPFMLPL